MEYKSKAELEKFCRACEKELLDDGKMEEVRYPVEARDSWNVEIIKEVNKELLSTINGAANVYTIFTAEKGSQKYFLKYIGQANSKGVRHRLVSHLIKKDYRTGAKLEKVMKHIQSGGSIKISWIPINPESLRHYVEEELIKKHPEADWNKHSKKKA